MFIDRIMTQPVVTIGPDENILQAKAKMDSHRIRHLPVVGQDGNLIGIITDRDLRSYLPSRLDQELPGRREMKKLSAVKVKDLMAKEPFTLSPYHCLRDALLMFGRARVGALPVVDERRRVTGMLSKGDILNSFIRLLGFDGPGTLLGVAIEPSQGAVMDVLKSFETEGMGFGSILVDRNWDKGRWALFAYLFCDRLGGLEIRLKKMGGRLIEPLTILPPEVLH